MNTGTNFSATDTLDPPQFTAWDSGSGALAICELLLPVDDREPALAAADAPVRSAEERCQAHTVPLSPGIVEEPWQRAEREQDRFYNGV